jgi:hypothetical protein
MTVRPRVLQGERRIIGSFDQVNPHAAGIDAGHEEHWVSIPEDRDPEPVQVFGTFTEDLCRLADWLERCRIQTVAIEATGVYWIPLVEMLESRGLQVRLVDSRSIGHRNKKTDVVDCQWIRQLHTFGLLDGAFRPAAQMLPIRAYQRQRKMLIEYAADHIRHMQKALDQMNLKLHVVLSDITGKTGLQIIELILQGERDPYVLAALRDPNCKNSEQTIAKALTGNYRQEHLFALRQAYGLFRYYQSQIAECDGMTQKALEEFDGKAAPGKIFTTSKKRKSTKRRKNQIHFDGQTLLAQTVGVDLVAIDGFDLSTALTIVSEIGTNVLRNRRQIQVVAAARSQRSDYRRQENPRTEAQSSSESRHPGLSHGCSVAGKIAELAWRLLPSHPISQGLGGRCQSHRRQTRGHRLQHAQKQN